MIRVALKVDAMSDASKKETVEEEYEQVKALFHAGAAIRVPVR